MKRNICNCLAFYDWNNKMTIMEWYKLAIEFFNGLGKSPNAGGVNDEDIIDFEVLDKKIKKQFNTKIKEIDLYLTVPNFKQVIFGWDITAELNLDSGKTMIFCFNNELHEFDVDFLRYIISRVTEICSPLYGIAYQRPFKLGPDLYAYGMTSGLGFSDEEMKENDRISAWMHERMGENRHLNGMLRDLYPINILTEKHLNSIIDGELLKDWIEKSNKHGDLVKITSENWIWNLINSDIELLKPKFIKNGLLIAHHKDIQDALSN